MKLVLIQALCISIVCHGFELDEKVINGFTREVYYRYYLIKRCEEPVEILSNHKELWKQINFDLLSTEKIKNAEIKNKIHALQKSHHIEPFVQLWHQINTHRHIDDTSFQKDFIKLLFMLYTSLEKSSQSKAVPSASVTTIPVFSIEKMLSVIDKNIENMRVQKKSETLKDYKFIDYQQVTTDDIALNYYLMQRLEKSMQVLSTIKDPFPTVEQKNTVDFIACDTGSNFSHERINNCFAQMLVQKNLDPLLHMWQDFTQFRHAGDAHFLKEMLMMLFTVYKDLLFVKINDESEEVITSEMNTILDLYEHINELPLDEILQAIDLTTDKLVLLQNMEKKGKAEWRQRYPIVYHTLLALPIAYFIIKTCAL